MTKLFSVWIYKSPTAFYTTVLDAASKKEAKEKAWRLYPNSYMVVV